MREEEAHNVCSSPNILFTYIANCSFHSLRLKILPVPLIFVEMVYLWQYLLLVQEPCMLLFLQ